MDIKQAGEYMNLKKSSLYRLTMQKKIPHIKIGRLLRFKKNDLDKFINQNLVEVGQFD